MTDETKQPDLITDVEALPTPVLERQKQANWTSVKIDPTIGIREQVVSVDAAYKVRTNDRTVLADGTFTVTLPTGEKEKTITVKNIGTGTITVSSSENIDGSSTNVLGTQYDSVSMVFYNEWHIVALA